MNNKHIFAWLIFSVSLIYVQDVWLEHRNQKRKKELWAETAKIMRFCDAHPTADLNPNDIYKLHVSLYEKKLRKEF